MNNRDAYFTFVKGFTHGAAIKPMDPKFTEHSSQEFRTAYERAYMEGQRVRRKACEEAAIRFNYQPNCNSTPTRKRLIEL